MTEKTPCSGQTKKGPCTNKAMYVVGEEEVCFIHLQTSLKEQLSNGGDSVIVRLVT
jgi:hypothetical protein